MSAAQRFGRGLAFPFVPERSGGSPVAEGVDKVAQSIRIILATEPGERVMRPRFGCGLSRFIMRPNTSGTRALIEREVERALTNDEPRIRLVGVRALADKDPAVVLIHIAYVHARDGRPGNMVFPFYLQE